MNAGLQTCTFIHTGSDFSCCADHDPKNTFKQIQARYSPGRICLQGDYIAIVGDDHGSIQKKLSLALGLKPGWRDAVGIFFLCVVGVYILLAMHGWLPFGAFSWLANLSAALSLVAMWFYRKDYFGPDDKRGEKSLYIWPKLLLAILGMFSAGLLPYMLASVTLSAFAMMAFQISLLAVSAGAFIGLLYQNRKKLSMQTLLALSMALMWIMSLPSLLLTGASMAVVGHIHFASIFLTMGILKIMAFIKKSATYHRFTHSTDSVS